MFLYFIFLYFAIDVVEWKQIGLVLNKFVVLYFCIFVFCHWCNGIKTNRNRSNIIEYSLCIFYIMSYTPIFPNYNHYYLLCVSYGHRFRGAVKCQPTVISFRLISLSLDWGDVYLIKVSYRDCQERSFFFNFFFKRYILLIDISFFDGPKVQKSFLIMHCLGNIYFITINNFRCVLW